MVTNVVQVNVYNVNLGTGGAVGQTFAFPSQGCLLGDCSGSPQRVLSNGLSVYSEIFYQNQTYYTQLSLSALVTLFNT